MCKSGKLLGAVCEETVEIHNCTSFSGADVEKTVEIPQLQRLCRTLLFTACRYATTGAGDGRDSAVTCGGSAVGTHRPACFLGPCTQVHGQGSPAIRAGKGWRGRRELASRCSATQLVASYARAWSDTPCRQSFVPHTPKGV